MIALFVLTLAGPALAQTGPAHIRGVVKSLEGDTLTVATREGPTAIVKLAPTWSVTVAKPVALDSIAPGSFIGTTEVEKADGTGTSLEVHVFPAGVKQGEGHYAWDLRPGSMMTNGTVDTAVTGVEGRTVTVSYAGGTRKVVVPPNVPVVGFGLGGKEMVKPGGLGVHHRPQEPRWARTPPIGSPSARTAPPRRCSQPFARGCLVSTTSRRLSEATWV